MSNLHWTRRVHGRRKAVIAVAVCVLVAGGVSAFLAQGFANAANSPRTPWLDANKPIQARVHALLGAMTLPEKVGQMDQQLVDDLTGPSNACGGQGWGQLNETCMNKWLVDNHTGSLLAGGTDNPPDTTGQGGSGNTGYDWAHEYNMIQKYAIQNSRLHIPLIFGVDAVHGFGHPWQAPLYPQSIGMGATWDPSAAEAGGVATANALRATGWDWTFAPVQDLSRDNRWGRTYETWAEEPVLSAAMGAANIRGLQSSASGRLARCHRDRQALRRLLAGDQRPRPQRGPAAVELPAERDPAVLRRRHRRRSGHGDGRLRFHQRRSGDRVALPADRHPPPPDALPGRRDQRLPGRAGAANGLPRRRQPG